MVTGSVVTLDGSGSFDADGNLLTYNWSFVSRPEGSSATLSNPAAVNPVFTADADGAYVLQLIVNDGLVNSPPDSVLITATAATLNSVPAAYAGTDQNVKAGSVVTLDGSGSSDADGNLLTYNWSFVSRPGGSSASLSSVTAVNPVFTADTDGVYVLQLIVNDGLVNSPPDSVIITATAETLNSAPVAHAGTNQKVKAGSVVTLDGSGSSDADGNLLTYNWSFVSRPEGSSATLSNPAAVNPVFTADADGNYVLQLIVNDGLVNGPPDSVIITATAATLNSVPAAYAGTDQNVKAGSVVTLDGSGSSDADGNLLTYNWSFVSRPEGSSATLSNPAAVNPVFTADADGSYVLQLIVNDGLVNSPPDSVIITATAARLNSAPAAYAGTDQNVKAGSVVTLDGSGSSDADGNLLTYNWSFVSRPEGSSATLSNPAAVNPVFTADTDGVYVLQLIVNDGLVNSPPDSVLITATAATLNSAPAAHAGTDQRVATNSVVSLNGSGSSDADGDPLTYLWGFVSKPEGSVVVLEDDASATPRFFSDVDGSYVIGLVVNDGILDSSEDNVVFEATSDYDLLFRKKAIAERWDLDDNGFYDPPSFFELTITNVGNIPFICYKAELFSGTFVVDSTEEQSSLGAGQIDPGESIRVRFSLNASVKDDGFQFRYYFVRSDTNENFIVVQDYISTIFSGN